MSPWKLVFAAALSWTAATSQPRTELTRYELEWSFKALPVIERQAALFGMDADAAAYVQALGKRLAEAAPEGWPLPCHFILYDGETGLDVPYFGRLRRFPGATPLPGGVVLVPLNLLRASADESEFAASIARAVAHVSLRHYSRTRGTRIIRPVPPADPLLNFFANTPYLKSWVFPRPLEREADYGAVAILARAGFDPDALARTAGNSRMSFDTSAPRVQAVERAVGAQRSARRAPRSFSSPEFLILKKRLGEPAVAL
jgi:hypothetical protein